MEKELLWRSTGGETPIGFEDEWEPGFAGDEAGSWLDSRVEMDGSFGAGMGMEEELNEELDEAVVFG